MFIQLGFAALFTVLSLALVVGTLNIAGIFIQACIDRDNKKS